MKKSDLIEITRSEVDDHRWDALVSQFGEGRPYAYTWYLDALTQGKWQALILGDYDAMMPLPYHRKYLYQRRVYQPFLSQSFGPIGQEITSDIVCAIAKHLQKQYPHSHLMLPVVSDDQQVQGQVEKRTTQLIDISRDIDAIRADYSKDRRRRIKINRHKVEVEFNQDIDQYFDYYKSAAYPISKPILRQSSMFMRLLKACNDHGCLEMITMKQEGELLNTAAMIITQSRVINLIGVSTELARSLSANALKIDAMIQRYCGDKVVFDFFGSSLPGVYKFNQQFGANTEHYLMLNT